VTLPSENGALTILPNHTPLVSTIKPWLISIWSDAIQREQKEFDYIFDDNKVTVSVSKGILFVDGENITIVTSAATKTPTSTVEELTSQKSDIEKKIHKLRESGWFIEEVQKWLVTLKKIEADLELLRLQHTKTA